MYILHFKARKSIDFSNLMMLLLLTHCCTLQTCQMVDYIFYQQCFLGAHQERTEFEWARAFVILLFLRILLQLVYCYSVKNRCVYVYRQHVQQLIYFLIRRYNGNNSIDYSYLSVKSIKYLNTIPITADFLLHQFQLKYLFSHSLSSSHSLPCETVFVRAIVDDCDIFRIHDSIHAALPKIINTLHKQQVLTALIMFDCSTCRIFASWYRSELPSIVVVGGGQGGCVVVALISPKQLTTIPINIKLV